MGKIIDCNKICDEKISSKELKIKKLLKREIIWLITIIFSLLPLFMRQLFMYIYGQVTVFNISDIFKDVSVVYIGVTAVVSAFIGIVGNGAAKGKNILISVNMLLLLFGTSIYGMLYGAKALEIIPLDNNMIFAFNIIYLIISVAIGTIDIIYDVET